MKKLIVYCHGYGSSANTDKVRRLAAVANSEVYAWNIHIDPELSLPFLEDHIDGILVHDMHDEAELVFVGTSLGGWYASKLAEKYGARAIIVNPSYDPSNGLAKYDVNESIRSKYDAMPILKNARYVIAKDDEVINFDELLPKLPNVVMSETGGHRFNGPEFEELVVNHI